LLSSLTIPQQEIRFRESLKVVPVHNAGVRIVESDDPDELVIEVQLRYEGAVMKALQRLFKLRPAKRYVLDGIGRKVYEAVDGRKTFEQLIDEFSAREKLTFFESRALLGQYFQTLTRRGVIVATLPRPD
jgi:hypothetical protein